MKYKESSLIVDVLSEKHGLVSCIVSGVRKKGSKTSSILFTPGYLLDLVYYASDPHKLWRIKEASLGYPLAQIPFDILRGNTALCICEILRKVIPVYDENPMLFGFVEQSIYDLDQIVRPGNIFLYFLIQLSHQLGFGIEKSTYEVNAYFDLKSGRFQAHAPSHPMYIVPELSRLFYQILSVELEQLSEVKMTRSQRQQLTDHGIEYVRYHTHAFERIKTYDVLKTLW